jgi:hypothetical protein
VDVDSLNSCTGFNTVTAACLSNGTLCAELGRVGGWFRGSGRSFQWVYSKGIEIAICRAPSIVFADTALSGRCMNLGSLGFRIFFFENILNADFFMEWRLVVSESGIDMKFSGGGSCASSIFLS